MAAGPARRSHARGWGGRSHARCRGWRRGPEGSAGRRTGRKEPAGTAPGTAGSAAASAGSLRGSTAAAWSCPWKGRGTPWPEPCWGPGIPWARVTRSRPGAVNSPAGARCSAGGVMMWGAPRPGRSHTPGGRLSSGRGHRPGGGGTPGGHRNPSGAASNGRLRPGRYAPGNLMGKPGHITWRPHHPGVGPTAAPPWLDSRPAGLETSRFPAPRRGWRPG